MNRQYPNTPDHFIGISEHSYDISDLSFIIILNDETMSVTAGFWNYIPNHGCQLELNYTQIPKGRNYVCLCNTYEEHWNRMFIRTYNYLYKINATMELTRQGRTGLLLQITPTASTDEDTDDENEGEPSTQIPSLQFLCAGQMSLQDSDEIRHINTESFKNNTYQNAKKFDMLPTDGYMGHTCICDGISMTYNYP